MRLRISHIIYKTHIQRVLDIEEAGFEEDSWDESTFKEHFQESGIVFKVATIPGDYTVGFFIGQLGKVQLNLINLAVDPAYQRQGVGTALLNDFKAKLVGKRTRIAASVMETNTPFLLFLKSQGFKAIGLLKDQFQLGDRLYDAVNMEFNV